MFSMQRKVLFLAVVTLLAVTTLLVTQTSSVADATTIARQYLTTAPQETRRLHFLVPATDPNLDFCRFLLSSTITGYPDPILIGWKSHGEYDGKQSHLFKISEGLAYLNALSAEQENDLVLMLDAYDIWMLLRPEVIISRYNKVMTEQARWLSEKGIHRKFNGDVPVENTILWGADKICWPRDHVDPSCWAVPESPMRKQEYGPDTDSWMVPNRPRWLNSGTLIGPVGHMREMFNATMENVHRTFDEGYEHHDSDQYYFQDVWAEQELTRMRLKDGEMKAAVVDHEGDHDVKGYVPPIPEGRRTEYRISLDYGIDLFQTAAGFTEYLAWLSFNNTTPFGAENAGRRRRLDELELPQEVLNSRPPFATNFPADDLPSNKTWKDVVLGVNTAEQTVWPLLHVTGDKVYRETWWHYMWFHPYAETLLRDASRLVKDTEEVVAIVDGVKYIAADTSGIQNIVPTGGRGGGWSDIGERFEWEDLCGKWESDPGLFLK